MSGTLACASSEAVLPPRSCPIDMKPFGWPGEISIFAHMWFAWLTNKVVSPAFVLPALVVIVAATVKSLAIPIPTDRTSSPGPVGE